MAWYRCGNNGGSQEQIKFSGRFNSTSGIALVDGRYMSNVGSAYYLPVTNSNTLPTYDLNKSMKIHLRFKISQQNSAAQALVAADSSVYGKPRIEFCGTQYNDILMTAGWSTSGSRWDSWLEVRKNAVPYSANSWYEIDYEWDGTTFSFTVTDGTHTKTAQATMGRFYSSNNNIIFGRSNSGSVPANRITYDLANCYYEQDGVLLWGNRQ